MNILFTCVGRRVALVEAFRSACRSLRIRSQLIGAEANPLSPALQVCDGRVITPSIAAPSYIDELVRIVRRYEIALVVPTIDTELKILAVNRERFAELGARVLISSPEVVAICQDKRATYRFLRENGFDTPATCWGDTCDLAAMRFPVFLKPWDGSASKGNAVALDLDDYNYFTRRVPNCLVQEFVDGREYTCDVYVDFEMKVRCVAPRLRLEVRAGEVSKGVTEKWTPLMRESRRLVEMLGAGPGVITLQAFRTADDSIKYIEINPRFGGGVPLSIQAGADFPRCIVEEIVGRRPTIRWNGFKGGLCMLRYDAAVWCARPPSRAGSKRRGARQTGGA